MPTSESEPGKTEPASRPAIEDIELVYTLTNSQHVHAWIDEDSWHQWGASSDVLTQTMPMTEALHHAALTQSDHWD